MKVWKHKKTNIAKYRLPLDDIRRVMVPLGYYNNRPCLVKALSPDIGRIERFSILETPYRP